MEDFVLPQSPNQFTFIVTFYLFIVKIGPFLMKNRQPFRLKKLLVCYNYSQIFFNSYFLFATFPVAHKITIFCESDDSNAYEITTMLKMHHMYLLLKFYDLLDTLFFVLRKKQEQISFLHVYHHVMALSAVWILLKYFPPTHYPGGPVLLFFTANCCVHTVMFTYYLKSAKGEVKNLSLKKGVTILQIVQHDFIFILVLNALVNGSDCLYPNLLRFLGVLVFFSMAYLFTRLYYRAYIRKKGQTQMEQSFKARVD